MLITMLPAHLSPIDRVQPQAVRFTHRDLAVKRSLRETPRRSPLGKLLQRDDIDLLPQKGFRDRLTRTRINHGDSSTHRGCEDSVSPPAHLLINHTVIVRRPRHLRNQRCTEDLKRRRRTELAMEPDVERLNPRRPAA